MHHETLDDSEGQPNSCRAELSKDFNLCGYLARSAGSLQELLAPSERDHRGRRVPAKDPLYHH